MTTSPTPVRTGATVAHLHRTRHRVVAAVLAAALAGVGVVATDVPAVHVHGLRLLSEQGR